MTSALSYTPFLFRRSTFTTSGVNFFIVATALVEPSRKWKVSLNSYHSRPGSGTHSATNRVPSGANVIATGLTTTGASATSSTLNPSGTINPFSFGLVVPASVYFTSNGAGLGGDCG